MVSAFGIGHFNEYEYEYRSSVLGLITIGASLNLNSPNRPLSASNSSSWVMVFRCFQKLHQDQSVPHQKSPPNPHWLIHKKNTSHCTTCKLLPSRCCKALQVESPCFPRSLPARLTHPTLRVFNSHQTLRDPPGQATLPFSIRLPARLTCPMPQVLNSRRMLREPSGRATLSFLFFSSNYRRGLPVRCCESLLVKQPCLFPSNYRQGFPV